MSVRYRLNLEEIEGRWIAHLVGWPGGFVSGRTRAEALDEAPAAIAQYFAWLRRHGETPPEDELQFEVDEVHAAWISEDEYEVNAFFAADRPPLSADEIQLALTRLRASRADLLDAFLGLSPDDLNRELPGERWPINGILKHVANAENWYLGRFGLEIDAGWDIPDPLGRLSLVRQHFMEMLPALAGDERVVAVEGELWSPRKVIRRALWHELDHAAHIRQLRQRF